MKKQQTLSLILLASSALLASNAFAQTSPASGSTQTPAAKPQTSSPAVSKPQSGTAAKKPAAPAAKPGTAAAPALKTDREKASYAIGANIGKSMKKEGVDLDPALVARGIKDGFSGGKLLLTDEQAQAALTAFSVEMKKKQEAELAAIAAANEKEGRAFLAENKAKPGVVTLPSGLEYKILTAGTGPKPTPEDTILCNYRGTLLDGKEFDSSYKRGQPTSIPVGGVIKGWTEALQLMPVGSKWQLFIPSELAYGPRQAGPDIGPNSTLIFEVELLSIQEKPKAEAPKDAAPQPQAAPQSGPSQPAQQTTPPPAPAPQPTPKPPSR